MSRIFDYAFFDFDGTIADTKEGIFNALKYAFKSLGLEEPPESELCKMIGPPLRVGFEETFGFKGAENDRIIEKYREHYREIGMFECKLYDGIEDTLRALKENGVSLSVASSKPLRFTAQLLEKFNLIKYFDYLSCPPMDAAQMSKASVILQALEVNNVPDNSRAVMIGDRFYDAIGAKEAGVDLIAALYGFGNEKEFEKYNVYCTAESPADIRKIIIGE